MAKDRAGGDTGRVFWHAGLAKTGSTYLQRRVFPGLQKIAFVRRDALPRAAERIAANKTTGDVLYSREFERGLEEKARYLAAHHPETEPLVVLRRHDDYYSGVIYLNTSKLWPTFGVSRALGYLAGW